MRVSGVTALLSLACGILVAGYAYDPLGSVLNKAIDSAASWAATAVQDAATHAAKKTRKGLAAARNRLGRTQAGLRRGLRNLKERLLQQRHPEPRIQVHAGDLGMPLRGSPLLVSSPFGCRVPAAGRTGSGEPDRGSAVCRRNGERWEFHGGIDLLAKSGSPVLAVAPGHIILLGGSSRLGYSLAIRHPQIGLCAGYEHLLGLAPGIRPGGTVSRGALLGQSGGDQPAAKKAKLSSGAHLHFSLHRCSQRGKIGPAIDPESLYARRTFRHWGGPE